MWRVRLAALAAAGGFLGVALGIRLLASGDGVLDSSGTLQQHSGTALYASMVYAGVFFLAPATRPAVAGPATVVPGPTVASAARSCTRSRSSRGCRRPGASIPRWRMI